MIVTVYQQRLFEELSLVCASFLSEKYDKYKGRWVESCRFKKCVFSIGTDITFIFPSSQNLKLLYLKKTAESELTEFVCRKAN